MKHLLLLRHAKSSWSDPALDDHERPLAGRGRRAAPLMGQAIAEMELIPRHVLCSTSVRTRQTLALAARHWPVALAVDYLAEIYHAGPDQLLRSVRRHGGISDTLMLVGHQPGLQAFALALSGEFERAARARMEAKFPTAALAVIEFDIEDWGDVAAGAGRLIRYLRPRDLESR